MAHRAHKIGAAAWRQCGRKKRYPDEFTAQKAAKACMQRRPGTPLRVYDCPKCSGWHLTHRTD